MIQEYFVYFCVRQSVSVLLFAYVRAALRAMAYSKPCKKKRFCGNLSNFWRKGHETALFVTKTEQINAYLISCSLPIQMMSGATDAQSLYSEVESYSGSLIAENVKMVNPKSFYFVMAHPSI